MAKYSFEEKCRRSVIGVEEKVPLIDGSYTVGINFDNAATTPPFYAVMREIEAFAPWYSSIHRGTGYKSMISSDLYDEGRQKIKKFVGADSIEDSLIYTKNTTESINVLAESFHQMHPDAVILCTQMEHLANDLPWRSKFCVVYAKVDKTGRLDLNDVEDCLAKYQGKIRLVAVSGASNVTGLMNPVYEIAAMAHRYGAEILVDGAQMVPHCAIDMRSHNCMEHIDYLVFSAHKMYAPFGVGVLIGPKRSFECGSPYLKGGGAIKLVTADSVEWDDPPYRQEAGTPNVIGTIAMLKAIDCLVKLDMKKIHAREQEILAYMTEKMRKIKGICLYGYTKKMSEKVSIISFSLPDIQHRLIAQILSYEFGIAVRSGLFCAHPYVQRLMNMEPETINYYKENPNIPFPGMVRVSLGLYQQYQEADKLIDSVRCIAENKKDYKVKYEKLFNKWSAEPSPYFDPLRRQLP